MCKVLDWLNRNAGVSILVAAVSAGMFVAFYAGRYLNTIEQHTSELSKVENKIDGFNKGIS